MAMQSPLERAVQHGARVLAILIVVSPVPMASAPRAAAAEATYVPTGRIVFVKDRNPGQYPSEGIGDIFTVNRDGTDLQQLTFDDANADPAWSPTGRAIAFSKIDSLGDGDLYVMNPDGSGAHSIVAEPDDQDFFNDRDAAWAPDESRIVVSFYDVSPSGGGHKRSAVQPGPSADDIAYCSVYGLGAGVSRVEPTFSQDIQTQPMAFSRRTVCAGDGFGFGNWSIARWAAGSTSETPVIGGNGLPGDQYHEPAWSPDGSTILVQKEAYNPVGEPAFRPDGIWAIHLADLSATQLLPHDAFAPAWDRAASSSPVPATG